MENWYEDDDRIYMTDDTGRMVAQVVFPDVTPGVVNIQHTYVDDSLRGHGVAGRLLEAAAIRLRQEHKRAVLTCPYARKWFAAHPEYQDIQQDSSPQDEVK